MKTTCFTILFSLLVSAAYPQECYTYGRQKGIEAFARGDCAAALQIFEGTLQCPDLPAAHDLPDWIRKAKQCLKPRTPRKTAPLVEPKTNGAVHWSEGYAEAKGQCIIDRQRYPLEAQAVLNAQRCAELVAKANLLELIQGVRIRRISRMEEFKPAGETLDGWTDGLLRYARPAGEPVTMKDVVEVTVQVPLKSISQAAAPTSGFLPPVGMTAVTDTVEHFVFVSGDLAMPALFPDFTDENGAPLYDGAARYRQTGRPAVQCTRAAEPDWSAGAEITVYAVADGSLGVRSADWPLLQNWLEAAEKDTGRPVMLVYP